ncbi:aminotransferase [Caldalkalibacillus thermarum]|uniref:aminotransferase-like domain-containing protein n=1 Tax=Caldalkalibacillus thermarum TaxID=296745 RepID=UPI001666B219|nr:PLP-dependent aminotransferase family protein [Caldalkalibacillus thermarum]GGK26564.1 aminotransferase [Caldalkalibacillus thermarum]
MQIAQEFTFSKRFPHLPLVGAAFSGKQSNVIPLSFGFPAPELLPVKQLSSASVTALQTQGKEALQYTGGIGQQKVIQWIKQRALLRSIEVEDSNIMITTGSMQGIDLVTRTLTDPGDHVWIESPSFFGAIRLFLLAEVQLTSFPIDEYGLRVDLVEQALIDARKNNKPIPKFLYVMPNYHNPSGVSLSVERRKKLAELAYEYNFFVVEDDAYVELSFSGKYLPAIYSFGPERVIYLSTFSKIVAPGIRMGWTITDKRILEKMKMLKSDGATSVFVQEITSQFLSNMDFDRHLNQLIHCYRSRRDAMIQSINDYFGDNVSFIIPDGGFFIWLTFPNDVDTTGFLQQSIDRGVSYIDGRHFYFGNVETNHLRLCFTYCNEEQIRKGISWIADSYFEYKKKFDVLGGGV